MKNLTQLGQQLLGIWKQLGLNQRITIALTGLGVIVGLVSLAVFSSRPDYSLLYGRLDPAEAGKVISTLEELGIPHKVSAGGGSILVPSDKVHQARMQLASRGMPRSDGVGFEIFDQPNFGISDFVQRANYVRAIQGELARTIGQLDQVESARVMVVLPENRLLLDSQAKPTASVFVKLRGMAELSPAAVNSIRFLVANAVLGLVPNQVSVVDNFGNVLSENQEADSIAGLSNNQLTARRNFEQYLTKKAESMLEKVLGPGQAVVRVSAEINWDSITRTEEKFDPDGQVVRSDTVTDDQVDSATVTQNGGTPGVQSNAVTETNSPSATPVNNNRTRKKVTTKQYELSKITNRILQSGGGLKKVTASVFIAQRLEGEGANRKPVARKPEEIQQLRQNIQNALGVADADITLTETIFNNERAVELTQKLEQQEKRTFWVDLGQKLLYPGLALGMFFLLWRTFKQSKPLDIPIGVPLGEAAAGGAAGANGHGRPLLNGKGRKGEEAEPGIVTVEVLNQLIRENPANVTQAVRAWLTRGNSSNAK